MVSLQTTAIARTTSRDAGCAEKLADAQWSVAERVSYREDIVLMHDD